MLHRDYMRLTQDCKLLEISFDLYACCAVGCLHPKDSKGKTRISEQWLWVLSARLFIFWVAEQRVRVLWYCTVAYVNPHFFWSSGKHVPTHIYLGAKTNKQKTSAPNNLESAWESWKQFSYLSSLVFICTKHLNLPCWPFYRLLFHSVKFNFYLVWQHFF